MLVLHWITNRSMADMFSCRTIPLALCGLTYFSRQAQFSIIPRRAANRAAYTKPKRALGRVAPHWPSGA